MNMLLNVALDKIMSPSRCTVLLSILEADPMWLMQPIITPPASQWWLPTLKVRSGMNSSSNVSQTNQSFDVGKPTDFIFSGSLT